MSKSILGVTVQKALSLFKVFKVTFTNDVTGIITTDGSSDVSVSLTIKEIHQGFSTLEEYRVPLLSVNKKGLVTNLTGRRLVGLFVPLVTETVVIPANTSRDYILANLVGPLIGAYVPHVTVLVLDQLVTSPTYNFYVNSEALVVVGQSDTTVRIHNAHNEPLSVKVNLSLQSK